MTRYVNRRHSDEVDLHRGTQALKCLSKTKRRYAASCEEARTDATPQCRDDTMSARDLRFPRSARDCGNKPIKFLRRELNNSTLLGTHVSGHQ